MRTQVAIVGAGPAGLLLGHLLERAGIDSVIVEARSRAHVEQRVRAGVLEQGTVDRLVEAGVGERLLREGLVHTGVELRFDGAAHRIPLSELTGGRAITVYGQQEVVKDLIAARRGPLLFDVPDVALDLDAPALRFGSQELRCDAIAGCDGFHGISRPSIPDGALTIAEREYPFAWLGVLAEVAPSSDELIYARHERGFALHSLRSPTITRLYLQVDPADSLDAWPDGRVWEELHRRFEAPGWTLSEGPIVEKSITPMRSFVAEPMQHGSLYLAGDAAHIVPPTGAKGLNLAVHDVQLLADALIAWYRDGDAATLRSYSTRCLARVWRVQHFSWWMTAMLHRPPNDDPFEAALQRSQLRYVTSSRAAATTLAENYVG